MAIACAQQMHPSHKASKLSAEDISFSSHSESHQDFRGTPYEKKRETIKKTKPNLQCLSNDVQLGLCLLQYVLEGTQVGPLATHVWSKTRIREDKQEQAELHSLSSSNLNGIPDVVSALFTDRFRFEKTSVEGNEHPEDPKSLKPDIVRRYKDCLRLGYQHRDVSVGDIVFPRRLGQMFHVWHIKPDSKW
jgi:hypothetical protein